MARALRDALLAAAVALALAIPLIGFKAVDTGGPLGLELRFGWVAIAVGAAFFGRIAVALRGRRRRDAGLREAELGERWPQLGTGLLWLIVIVAILLPVVAGGDRRMLGLATQVLIYVMLGWGLNVVVGLAGLLDLGYVAFYAVGAYSYAILARDLGLSFWACLPLAGAFSALFGILLGFPVLRLRGDYLAIVTLGFGEMIRLVLINWQSFTGGPNGLLSIPRPGFFGFAFDSEPPDGTIAFHQWLGIEYSSRHLLIFLYYLILALALVTHALTNRLRRLPIGRAWEALREDEIASRALGINPTAVKLSAFAIGAMFGGFAGAFFATRQGFISPESFTFMESASILAIVVLGGMGSQLGVVVAAAVLVLLPEYLREFADLLGELAETSPLLAVVAGLVGDLGQYRMLVFGGAMVAIMVWRPHGLVTRRAPTIRLA